MAKQDPQATHVIDKDQSQDVSDDDLTVAKHADEKANVEQTRVIEQSPEPLQTTPKTETQTTTQLTSGTLLKNRFELLEEIGHGGMGTVYKALDKRDIEAEQTTFLAVKVLNENLQADNALMKALHREAKKSQELAHPNIVTVYDFDREDDRIFLTMEYMDGVSLDQVIRGNPKGLPMDDALKIIDQLGAALSYAHSRHIVHSDFKPSNVFVSRDKRVKVIDFGIARVVKSERSETFDAGVLRGLTPAYASLEMFQDQEPDPKDDIYALACVAYELLTGHHPYKRQRADRAKRESIKPEKPRKLNKKQWQVLLSGLQLDRDKRIDNVTDFYLGLHTQKTHPLVYTAAGIIPLVIAAYLLKEPLQRYWQQTVQPPSAPHPEQLAKPKLPAVYAPPSVLSDDCLAQKRILMIVRKELQNTNQPAAQITLDNPGLYALVHQSLKGLGLNFIDVDSRDIQAQSPDETLYSHLNQRFDLDYVLNVTLSARETPISTVTTAMKTVQGHITLELVDSRNEQILGTATTSFKQPGLDMQDILEKKFKENIDTLSNELFNNACS